jgi:Flp pilus assembly protein TadG
MRPMPLLRRLSASARRLACDARGVALVEFAICLPVLILLYLGAYVISDAITCNRKVTRSARAVTDLFPLWHRVRVRSPDDHGIERHGAQPL